MSTRCGPAARRWLLLGVVAAFSLPGCGGGKTPTGSISGKVTLDGAPLATGVVLLSNQATGVGASATLDSSGAYRIESIAVGEYQVAVRPPPPPAPHEMPQAGAAPRVSIPQKYQDPKTSGQTATIAKGANTQDFAL